MEEVPLINVKISYQLVNDEIFEDDIKIYDYTKLSLAIGCGENFGKAFKEKLKEIGSRYNPSLTKTPHKGWVLPRSKYPDLQLLVSKIVKKEIKGEVPVEYKKKTAPLILDGPMGPLPSIPPLIVGVRQLFENLSSLPDSEVQTFMDGSNRYVWGSIEKVDKLIQEMNLNPFSVFTTMGHKIVISK